MCVSLTLYYDVIPMVYIVTITPVPYSVPGDGMCQGSAIITSRSMQLQYDEFKVVDAMSWSMQ